MPFGITAGPNNTVWFTEWSGNQIGSIDTRLGKGHRVRDPDVRTRSPRESRSAPTATSGSPRARETRSRCSIRPATRSPNIRCRLRPRQPYGITTGPGGNLCFTEYTGNQIGVYSPEQFDVLAVLHDSARPIPSRLRSRPRLTATSGSRRARPTRWRCSTPRLRQITEADDADGRVGSARNRGRERRIDLVRRAEFRKSRHDRARLAHGGDKLRLRWQLKLGETFGLTVAVEYRLGAVDTGYEGSVSLALAPVCRRLASLAGTTSVTAVNGIATFNGLSLLDPGSYSIQVKSGTAAPATVGPINVTGPIESFARESARASARPPHRSCSAKQLVIAGKGKNKLCRRHRDHIQLGARPDDGPECLQLHRHPDDQGRPGEAVEGNSASRALQAGQQHRRS